MGANLFPAFTHTPTGVYLEWGRCLVMYRQLGSGEAICWNRQKEEEIAGVIMPKDAIPEVVEYFAELIYEAFRKKNASKGNPPWFGLPDHLREDYRVCVRAMLQKQEELCLLDEMASKVNYPEAWERLMKRGKYLLDYVRAEAAKF